MNRRRMGMSLAEIGVLAVVTLLSLASAQIDDRARALIDGIQPGVAQEIETIDQSMVITSYLPDGTTQETRSRTVIDFVNRRMITFTALGEDMPSMVMIYQDGKATMTMSDTLTDAPAEQPVPPDIAESLEATFDTFDQPASLVLKDADTATYDGPVDYEVLKGEQVTYTTTLPGSTDPVTAGYVFQGGKLLGTHMVAEGLEIVSVYDAPVSSFATGAVDNTTYILQNGTWTKSSHFHFEASKINEPIDESLFE